MPVVPPKMPLYGAVNINVFEVVTVTVMTSLSLPHATASVSEQLLAVGLVLEKVAPSSDAH
jgi:hypothetical protein